MHESANPPSYSLLLTPYFSSLNRATRTFSSCAISRRVSAATATPLSGYTIPALGKICSKSSRTIKCPASRPLFSPDNLAIPVM